MNRRAKIYVAGHTGLVGSALMRALWAEGYVHVITRDVRELDLRNQVAVEAFFASEHPEYVFLAAARVGGILANCDFPADFMYDNLMIQTNVIRAAATYGVKKLIFLGSSCIYPRDCEQPIREEYLLTGPLEPTNEPYAIAKITGVKLCQAYNKQHGTNFLVAMPTNLYGPGDNFDMRSSHVVPALIARFIIAQQQRIPQIVVWGTGVARREFLYVDDLAQALIFLMCHYEEGGWINVGTGSDCSIKELAYLIKELVGYEGEIIFDRSKPDGTPRKLLDISRITSQGWAATTSLREGILRTMVWYREHQHELRKGMIR